MKKQKIESRLEKEEKERNMKFHQKRIKEARKKGKLKIEEGPDLSHVHNNLKKKQFKKELNDERNWHDKNTKRRMDEYVSTVDNDGAYLLEWMRLLEQLRRQKDFDVNSKYKNVHSLYMQIMKELPDLDLNNLPDQNELVRMIKEKNLNLFKKLVAASTPKKRRRRRSGKSGRGRGRGRGRRKRGRKKKGRGVLNRLDVEDGVKTDEEYSSDEDDGPRYRRKRSSSFSTTRVERNEQEERHRFLKAFLPTDLQVGIDGEEKKGKEKGSNEKKEEADTNNIEAETKPAKPKKGELETELEVKMAKEIWGFVFDQVKKKHVNIGGGITGNSGSGSQDGTNIGNNHPDGGNFDDDDVSGNKRRKRGGFSVLNMQQERNMDDINEYSGDEEEGEDKPKRKKREPNVADGDMDDYSGDEEDGAGKPLQVKTKRKKKKPDWKSPSKLASKYDYSDDDLKTATNTAEPDPDSFDWGSSPVPRGHRPPRFSDYLRDNGNEDDDDEVRRSRPSSSYDELEIDRGLVIENLGEYEFIGISMIWLKALSHFSHMFLFTPVISILDHKAGLCKGGVWGQMKCGVVPTDPEGHWMTNHHVHAVEDPSQLIGKPYHFKLRIESLKGDIVKRITDDVTENNPDDDVYDEKEKVRRRKISTALFVKYQMDYIKDQRITDKCERISRVNEDGVDEEGVLFHFEKEYSFPYVTSEILFFLRNNAIRFEIYMKKKYLEEAKKTLFSL